MSRKMWLVFTAIQLIGIGLGVFSMQYEVGIGGIREYLWIPAVVMLFPGILLAWGIGALDVMSRLGRWHGAPFFLIAVLCNIGFWTLLKGLLRIFRRTQPGAPGLRRVFRR